MSLSYDFQDQRQNLNVSNFKKAQSTLLSMVLNQSMTLFPFMYWLATIFFTDNWLHFSNLPSLFEGLTSRQVTLHWKKVFSLRPFRLIKPCYFGRHSIHLVSLIFGVMFLAFMGILFSGNSCKFPYLFVILSFKMFHNNLTNRPPPSSNL